MRPAFEAREGPVSARLIDTVAVIRCGSRRCGGTCCSRQRRSKLGHAGISTTLNIYMHVVDASHRRSASRSSPSCTTTWGILTTRRVGSSRSQTRWAHGVAYAPGMICYQSNRNGPATGPKSGPTFLYPLATLRGRPPRRPLARELAALRSLVRRPTNAAAVTRFTLGRARPPADIDTLATLTSARGCSCGWTSRYALSVRVIALAAFARVGPCAYTGNPG